VLVQALQGCVERVPTGNPWKGGRSAAGVLACPRRDPCLEAWFLGSPSFGRARPPGRLQPRRFVGRGVLGGREARRARGVAPWLGGVAPQTWRAIHRLDEAGPMPWLVGARWGIGMRGGESNKGRDETGRCNGAAAVARSYGPVRARFSGATAYGLFRNRKYMPR